MATLPTTPVPRPAEPASDWSALNVHTPGVCGGQARIDGTRITVKHVYRWVEEMGMAPAQVVEQYPHLTRAQVHAALAYYWSHRDETHRDIDEEDRFVAELKAKAGPSKLQSRLATLDAQDDSLSPG
jgi:uncharacterized protein (DUF433 family)